MIYVPEDSTYNKCYVVQIQGVIRGYDRIPTNNANYNYRDYYIDSDYIYRDGSGTWSQYSTLPTCIISSDITNDIMYRHDIDRSLIIFFILSIFAFYIPIKIFMRLFRRFNWWKILNTL